MLSYPNAPERERADERGGDAWKKKEAREREEPRLLPPLGQRIVKTSVAVFLCLLFYWLRGYRGQDMPTEAAITAIICMQPYVRDTRDYAVSRFAGTLIGAVWGLLFLLVFLCFPALGERLFVVYALMAVGVLASLYSAVMIRKHDASGLAAIVFLCIVIAFPDFQDPLRQTGDRIFGVLLGTGIAIAVNVFRLPRSKNRDQVFFVRTRDLAPDRFSQIPSAALYRLNYLCKDGAKICLMSEHAPAFFTLQMSEAMLGVPLIVMGGAAIYDADENVYLYAETIRPRDSQRVREHLERMGLSYFVYTVHGHKTRIFHRGEMRQEEQVIFRRMKRSPYRDYLDEGDCAEEEIVYLKLIGTDEEAGAWLRQLQSFLHSRHLRAVIRPEAGTKSISALYIYSAKASVKQAESKVMELLRKEDPALRPVEVFLDRPYQTEHDAMHLLHRLGRLYEPLRCPGKGAKSVESKHSETGARLRAALDLTGVSRLTMKCGICFVPNGDSHYRLCFACERRISAGGKMENLGRKLSSHPFAEAEQGHRPGCDNLLQKNSRFAVRKTDSGSYVWKLSPGIRTIWEGAARLGSSPDQNTRHRAGRGLPALCAPPGAGAWPVGHDPQHLLRRGAGAGGRAGGAGGLPAALPERAPKLALIEQIEAEYGPARGFEGFTILQSHAEQRRNTLVSPDIGICDDCRRELLDPRDRRYRYPFINCTNCGPRFTIIRDLPYDRALTSMGRFPMCPDCDREYHDIENRRYHAQPDACPVCGPHVFFLDGEGREVPGRRHRDRPGMAQGREDPGRQGPGRRAPGLPGGRSGAGAGAAAPEGAGREALCPHVPGRWPL